MKAVVKQENGDILILKWHLERRSLLGISTNASVIDSYTRLCKARSKKLLHRMILEAQMESYVPFCEHDNSNGRHGIVKSCKYGCRPNQHAVELIKAKRELYSKAKEL